MRIVFATEVPPNPASFLICDSVQPDGESVARASAVFSAPYNHSTDKPEVDLNPNSEVGVALEKTCREPDVAGRVPSVRAAPCHHGPATVLFDSTIKLLTGAPASKPAFGEVLKRCAIALVVRVKPAWKPALQTVTSRS